MNIVAYGGGTNSTAMLIECVVRSIDIELILFADTGGERPYTYAYIEMFSQWLTKHGMPPIVTVANAITLEQRCLNDCCLPSIAYGFKSCSLRFKVQPQDRYINSYSGAKNIWKTGKKICKLIGIDADEPHRSSIKSDNKYVYRYPLVEWGIGRDECETIIKKQRLPLPGKSACFFCPSTKVKEIRALNAQYPELAQRAIIMERNAQNTHVVGLGRRFSWENVLSQSDFFDYPPIPIACDCYD